MSHGKGRQARRPVPLRKKTQAFVSKHSLALALCLIAIAAVRIVSTYNVFGSTSDEPAHVACGLEYLAKHVYVYETQHPPLARAMVALGPWLAGARPRGKSTFMQEGWEIITYQGHPELTLFLMRLGTLPFFLLGSMVVYLWARRYFGDAVAAVATGLFTLTPPVLAHAGMACTDMALAACLGAAFLALVVWAEEPTFQHGLLLGICAAMAGLSKYTSLGYLPAAAVLALLFFLAAAKPGAAKLLALARERAPTFGLAVLTGATCIWAAYFFSFGKVPVWNVALPAPEYFDGVRVAMMHNRIGHDAFLLGQARAMGWWYYFPVALAVKTPIACLLLLLGGLAICWKNRAKPAYLLPAAFCLGILLPAMTSHVNIGVRHVLPVYIGFSIVAAVALVQLAAWEKYGKWAGTAAVLLTLWLAVSGAVQHPDYLSYFNEMVREPDQVLVDSDYDWGQDTKRLAARLHELGANEVSYGAMYAEDQNYLQTFPGLPHIRKINPFEPAEGWTAVNPTLARATQYGLNYRYPNLKPWFEYLQPKERVGTIQLYYVAPGSLRQAQ